MTEALINRFHSAEEPRTEITQEESSVMFFCVGNNHRTANIATREVFYLSPEQIESSIAEASKQFGISELAVLSTCNRCEVFGVYNSKMGGELEFLHEVYAAVHRLADGARSIDPLQLKSTLYVMTGLDAVRHAFQVASSLDSLVPGETQITGQFKDAMAISKNAGTFGPMLNRLSQAALATAKNVRTNTDIGRHKISISHAAIDLARRASNDLSQLRFLIIGAGEMARVAAEYAATYSPKALMIANRNHQKAFELTEHLGTGEHHGLENLSQLIARADVVISATSATGHVIEHEHVKRATQSRDDGPLFLIDIALPRDIDPSVSEIPDVYLFDIDDLKSVVESHMEKRRDAVRAATDIVRGSVDSFAQWLTHHEVAPTISASSKYLNDILQRESSKTLSKEIFADLTSKQRESIDSMLEAISSRVTADIAQSLRKAAPDEVRSIASALDLIFKKDPAP